MIDLLYIQFYTLKMKFLLVSFIVFLCISYVLSSETPKPKCPKNCTEPLFLPDTDCCKFWQCHDGKAVQFSCPTQLNWNPVAGVCDWPDIAGCTGNGWDDCSLECPTTTAAPTTTPAPRPPPCAKDNPKAIYYPEIDCHKYWECSGGKAYLFVCPDGLHWNPVVRSCDWPDAAGCTGEGWSTTTTERPSTTPP